jgi:hypothetical protein
MLLEALGQVNNMQQEADQAVQQLVTGGDVNPRGSHFATESGHVIQVDAADSQQAGLGLQEVNNIRI